MTEKQIEENGFLVNWAIRYDDKLIGGIGRHLKYDPDGHRDEIGYWLGKAHWNKGIMTKVLKVYTDHLRSTGLQRIEAPVFTDNTGSQRVLEKTGFKQEGLMRHAYKKKDTLLDAYLYALTF